MQTIASGNLSESIINDEPRRLEFFEIGDVSHQGDLIVVRIASLPKSAKKRANRQLADGNTQGSRHVLVRGTPYDADRGEVAELIRQATVCPNCPRGVSVGEQYIGPVFVSPAKPSANDLEHPEHGNQGFPAGAVCAVVYQRNLDAEERERRTQD